MPERWMAIAGFEGQYEVSDCGKVRSLPRTCFYKDGRSKPIEGRVLKLITENTGYLAVTLPNKTRKTVHSLVLETFKSRPDGVWTVNHKNGIKSDNNLDNLEWATYQQNNRHARETRLNNQHGTYCNLTKFGDDTIDAARILYESKRFTRSEIAKLLSMSTSHVWEVTTNRSRTKETI